MKIRDPRTGFELRGIEGARCHYCKSIQGQCEKCNLHTLEKVIGECCDKASELYPAEAARLMGYEIIGEEEHMKEKKKPRIGEILGVEVGERFAIDGFDGVVFWLLSDGTFATRPPRERNSTNALLRTIEHPELIIRKPRWTEAEVMLAKGFMEAYPFGEIERRDDGTLWFQARCFPWRPLPPKLLPSLLAGAKVRLADITDIC